MGDYVGRFPLSINWTGDILRLRVSVSGSWCAGGSEYGQLEVKAARRDYREVYRHAIAAWNRRTSSE